MVARAVLTFALVAVLPLLLAVPAAAETEDEMLARVKELQDEGTKWFNVAGNTDLSHSDRNEARRKSYVALKKAYKILDDFLEDHPERIETYEDRMVQIHMMIYWIRKESPLGVLPPDPEDEPEDDGGSEPGPAPEPTPEPGPKPEPGPDPEPPTHRPPNPAPPTPEPAAISPAEIFAKIEQYERAHPADIAGALARYRSFMGRFPDPDDPLFQKALERVSILSSRLKAAYRELRQEDPDSLDSKRLLSMAERKLVLGLTRDLKDRSPEVRRRAALDLGRFGSSEASYHLVKRLKYENDAGVVEAIRQAIVMIGGRKTTEELRDLARARKTEELLAAIDLLAQIGAKDRVQGKYAGIALASFTHCADATAGRKAYDTLQELGPEGGGVDGLMEALTVTRAPVGRRRLFILALGKMGDPRAAMILGRFFQQKGNRSLRDEAEKAIFALGVETVPYLIPYLSGNTRIYTGFVLRRLTGVDLKSYPNVWRAWWERH